MKESGCILQNRQKDPLPLGGILDPYAAAGTAKQFLQMGSDPEEFLKIAEDCLNICGRGSENHSKELSERQRIGRRPAIGGQRQGSSGLC